MIVTGDGLDEHYREIVARCRQSSCAVLILVSNEPDSLCCCHILASLLRSDLVPYMIKPVRGYDDMLRANFTLIQSNPDLSTIIMINCGATVDLLQLLELDANRMVYVLDSHRPYHLANVQQENEQVVIFSAEEVRLSELPELLTADEEALGSSDEDEPDEPDDYLDEDDDRLWDTPPRDDGGGEDEVGERRGRRKRVRRSSLSEEDYYQLRQSRRRKVNQLQKYYRSSYYETAASNVGFLLANQLNKPTLNLLWLAVVGVTDQFLHERIDEIVYNRFVSWAADEIKHFTPDPDPSVDNGRRPPQAGQIQLHTEYRFMLVRHWNLYDSMYNSKYVATRLGIWRDGGKRKLKLLLSKVGLPLRECRAAFRTMGKTFREALEHGLALQAEEYSLPSITFGSFTRQHGANFRISAADLVHSLSALLENPSANEDGLAWERNFWVAYDAILSHDDKVDLLKHGLSLSVIGQKAIVKQGVALITNKRIVSSGPFRYAIIEDSPDQALFCHPLILSKLALFLVDALVTSIRKPAKPLVLACYNPDEACFLVVGVPGPSSLGSSDRILNPFGTAFRQAADQTKSRYKHDSFETSVMQVQKDDIHKFFELLHSDLIKI